MATLTKHYTSRTIWSRGKNLNSNSQSVVEQMIVEYMDLQLLSKLDHVHEKMIYIIVDAGCSGYKLTYNWLHALSRDFGLHSSQTTARIVMDLGVELCTEQSVTPLAFVWIAQ